jgi:hypothetical protein
VEDSESTLLATQIIQAVTLSLRAEDDPDQMVMAMDLLTRWLPAARQLPEAAIATGAIALASAVAATVRADLTVAARTILAQLPEEQAASCASHMAAALPGHRDPHDAIGTTLRDTLIDYLQRSESSTAAATRESIANCLDALTADVEAISPAGQFTRSTVPLLLTTAPGREMATPLINRLSGALSPDPNHALQLLPSLHVLLREPAAQDAHLPAVIARVQPFISSAFPHIALDFAAPYITTTALDVNWLNWFASRWPDLQQSTRSLAVAAAARPDLLSVPALRDHLVQYLLETDDAEPWQYAETLWPQATTDQQSSLLAHADGRCPELARCASPADADLLSAALVKAGAKTSSLLSLIQEASAFDEAVALYLNNRLTQPEWTPEAAHAAIARVHDPAVLWKHVQTALTEGQSSAARAAVYLAALIESHPGSVPDDLVSALAPVLREAEPALATEIGAALRSLPKTARKLRKSMDGYSSTSAQRARNAAFKAASGISAHR